MSNLFVARFGWKGGDMSEIGIGVLGVGMMGKYICPINQEANSTLRVKQICDLNPDLLEDVGNRYNVADRTTSYEEMLSRDDVQVIAVFTPDHMHIKHCLQAFEAGKHLIITKPMVMNLDEARQVINAKNKSGRKCLVGQTMRFNLRMMAARQLVDDGELGDIIFGDAYYTHDYRPYLTQDAPWRRNPPLDLLVGGGCHPIDLITWYMGQVEEVHAYANNGGLSPGYTLEDNFLINLKFKSGRMGRVMAAYGIIEPPHGQIAVTLYGEKGTWMDNRYVLDKFPTMPVHNLEFNTREQGHSFEVIRYLKHFEDCLINDKEPQIGPEHAAHVLAVTDAVWTSVRKGGVVKVEEV
ncbi:MAG: Gfo/Idh/MocA family oxidoreductase [Armatimonadota bacterium]